jgi:hypothetical protein
MTQPPNQHSPIEIQPIEVDLSHQQVAAKKTKHTNPRLWMVMIFGASIALVIAALFWLPKFFSVPVLSSNPTTVKSNSTDANPASQQTEPRLAPFAASQKQLARGRAEQDLKTFVELQLQLEESMAVGEWGQQNYDAALDLAAQGDEAFLQEDFETAIRTYSAAAGQLTALIEVGEALITENIAKGEAALIARQATDAMQAFDTSLSISSSNVAAQAGRERALLLPEVIRLERKARNQELAQDWAGARASYEAIYQLDPKTSDLDKRLAQVSAGSDDLAVKAELTTAFAALESRQYSLARKSFNAALSIDPGNSVAAGGLEQIRQETEIGKIGQLQQRSSAAAAKENWAEAIGFYQQALAIDANIAFASLGLDQAQQQQRAFAVLERIIANPDKLSSNKLLEDGQRVVNEAKSLEQQGPKLKTKLQAVQALLVAYSTPVDVTIHSDAQTQVVLSSVGELGSFSNKTVSLRPGAYTVIGSRDGCRDVREKITVRPGMPPLDIRCREQLR